MAVAGPVVEGMFAVGGSIPTDRPDDDRATGFHWNYTTFLEHRVPRRRRATCTGCTATGNGSAAVHGYAIDPVCGMQVQTADAPASALHDGTRLFFCSDHCRDRFEADVRRQARRPSPPETASTT